MDVYTDDVDEDCAFRYTIYHLFMMAKAPNIFLEKWQNQNLLKRTI